MSKAFAGFALIAGLLAAGCTAPAPRPEAPAADTAAAPAAPVPAVPLDTKADGALPGAAADRPTDQTTPEQRAQAEAAAAAVGLPPTAQTRTSFACDNGEDIEVRFFPDQGIAVLVRGGQNTELNGEPVASGFQYSNGQTTIRGKGDELQLNVGMMATATCKAKAG